MLKSIRAAVPLLLLAACQGAPSPTSAPPLPDDPAGLIEAYAKLDLDSKARRERPEVSFDSISRTRTEIEYRLILAGPQAVQPLTEALKHQNRHVRAMAVEVLGVIGDPSVTPAVAEMAKDPDAVVRMNAIQTLGWLKAPADTIKQAEKEATAWVRYLAERALEQAAAGDDLRTSFSPLQQDELGSAEVGKPAPDFTLPTLDGTPWKLSDHFKGTVVLMFQLADW